MLRLFGELSGGGLFDAIRYAKGVDEETGAKS